MSPLLFLHRVWGGVEAGWASRMHPRPCTTRCRSRDPSPPAEPTKRNLQEKPVGVGDTLPFLLSNWGCEEKSSSHQREKLPLVPRPFFSPCRSPDPVLTIHGGTPSGALRFFPILLSSQEILVKNWAQSKQRGIHRTTAFYSSSHPWLKLSASSDCTKTQDCSSKERGKKAAWSLRWK